MVVCCVCGFVYGEVACSCLLFWCLDRYDLFDVFGSGMFGAVYCARHMMIGDFVVVKVLCFLVEG